MDDPQSKNNFRYIRFVGDSVSRWGDIIDEMALRQIPVELIDSVKFVTKNGNEISVKISELVGSNKDNIGESIDQAIESKKENLKAVEFAVNFDKLEEHIVDAIVKLFDTSET